MSGAESALDNRAKSRHYIYGPSKHWPVHRGTGSAGVAQTRRVQFSRAIWRKNWSYSEKNVNIARRFLLLRHWRMAVPEKYHPQPGPLTADEYEKVNPSSGRRRHAGPGSISYPARLLCWHPIMKRWAGGGYPHGLGSETNPIGARNPGRGRRFDGADLWLVIIVSQSLGRSCGSFDPETAYAYDPKAVPAETQNQSQTMEKRRFPDLSGRFVSIPSLARGCQSDD